MAIELTREVFDIDVPRKYFRKLSHLTDKDLTAEMLNPTIGFDADLDIDIFQQPMIRAGLETFALTVYRLLFLRPGQYPSMPELGIDIEKYLFDFWDNISEEQLTGEIISQCSLLQVFISAEMLTISKIEYRDEPVLIIQITSSRREENKDPQYDEVINIGITFDRFKQLVTSIEYGS